MSGNRCTGTSTVDAQYCGHRAWTAYTNREGRAVQAGGSVTVREQYPDQNGEIQHDLNEYRLPSEDVETLAAELNALDCGDPIQLHVEHWRSARGKQWDNLTAIDSSVLA